MARTQAADYDQRRDAILDIAARLFARAGFAETSMSALADACGMSKSLLYHYYPSKEDILHAVMASHIDQLCDDVSAAEMSAQVARPQLEALIRAFMRHYAGAADRQKVLLNELDSLPADKRRAIVHKQRRIIDAVQRMIVALYPALGSDPARARVQTMLVFGMINWTHTWFDPKGALSVEAVANMVLDLAIPGDRTQAS
jgi:AcrR family transcriptional regulator